MVPYAEKHITILSESNKTDSAGERGKLFPSVGNAPESAVSVVAHE